MEIIPTGYESESDIHYVEIGCGINRTIFHVKQYIQPIEKR